MDIFAVPPRFPQPVPFAESFELTLKLAESYGLRGVLLFDGNDVPFSPWVLAQHVLARSKSLLPLIAVSPAYLDAEEAARRIDNLHRLYGRPLAINLVAGAEARTGAHGERYQVLHQFSRTLDEHLTRRWPESPDLEPIAMRFVAGHSADAAMLAAQIGASNLRMLPSTLGAELPAGCALNFGIVTRPTTAEAWAHAKELFPERSGAALVAQRVASRTDSQWKAELLSKTEAAAGYWQVPAQSLKADSPFYVGSYDEAARLFAECRSSGVSALLLDLPSTDGEYAHLTRALQWSHDFEERFRHG